MSGELFRYFFKPTREKVIKFESQNKLTVRGLRLLDKLVKRDTELLN